MTDISHVNLIIFPCRLQVHEPVVKHISSPTYHSPIPESEPHNIQANADTAGNPYHKSLLPLFTSSTSSDEMNRCNLRKLHSPPPSPFPSAGEPAQSLQPLVFQHIPVKAPVHLRKPCICLYAPEPLLVAVRPSSSSAGEPDHFA